MELRTLGSVPLGRIVAVPGALGTTAKSQSDASGREALMRDSQVSQDDQLVMPYRRAIDSIDSLCARTRGGF